MPSENSAFWKNKQVLITGISGFVGGHLSKSLEKKGAKVWGISRKSEMHADLKADIVDYSAVNEIITAKKINICFHLAAESLVESGQIDPYKTFKVNTLGTLNILESARQNNLDRVIIASTSHVYGANKVPYKEDYPPKPSRPYETSKTCIDLIAQSYADTFNLPVLIPRFSNTYGPGDLNFGRLIPKTIKSVLLNERPKMWGGGAIRDYIYIDDVVAAYMKLAMMPAEAIEKNRIFNFGTGSRLNVRDMINLIIKLSQKELTIEKISKDRVLEINKQYVSSAKAKRVLGWRPKVPLDNGLAKTIAWYNNYLQTQS